MRSFAAPLALATILSLFVPCVATAQKRAVSHGRLAGEIAAGYLGAPIGFAVGYTIGSGLRPHGSSNTGVAGGVAGALLGPALGVNWVGNGGPSHGNFGTAIGGAALGYGALYFVVPAAARVNPTKLKILAMAAAFALPSVGATLAYNATRK